MDLVLHIGTPKTGSTAIQSFLFENRQKLLEKGVLLPTTGWNYNQSRGIWRSSGHSLLLDNLEDIKSNIVIDLRREINKYENINTVLITSENMSTQPDMPLFLSKIFTDMKRVRIVIYLRRQDLYLESLYAEFISGGWYKVTDLVDDFFLNYVPPFGLLERDYNKLLKPWENSFGKKNIIVRPFEKGQWFLDSLIRDFLHSSGIPWSSDLNYDYTIQHNPSIPAQSAKIVRDINKIPIGDVYYRKALSQIYKLTVNTKIQKEKQFFSSPSLRLKILKKYEKSNGIIAMEYLKRKDQKLFYEPWPEAKDSWEPVRITDPDLLSHLLTIFIKQKTNEINESFIKQKEKIEEQKNLYISLNSKLSSVEKKMDHIESVMTVLLQDYRKDIPRTLSYIDKHKQLTLNLFSKVHGSNWRKIYRFITRKNLKELKLIRGSGLFDNAYYLKTYTDVIRSSLKPDLHYLKFGAAEGRNPSTTFNTINYIADNPIVALKGINPLIHYLLSRKYDTIKNQ